MKTFAMAAAILTALAALSGTDGGVSPSSSEKGAGARAMLKGVVHVNFADAERQKHGLKNVSNILKGAGGPANIVVVCHGGGLSLVVKDQSSQADEVQRLLKAGVKFAACENTMREKSVSKESLVEGVATVPSGAVEVIRMQQDGFGYFKP